MLSYADTQHGSTSCLSFQTTAYSAHWYEGKTVAPATLFGRSEEAGDLQSACRVAPAPHAQPARPPFTAPTLGGEASRASSTLSRPASSLLLSKPFRCPKPNCNKSYKQANDLEHHIAQGSCSFLPSKDLGAVQALLAEKGLSADRRLARLDAHSIEREAERRLRPFACSVGECARRYRSMNGLRYHYQRSEHGAEGLRLLLSGQHGRLQHHGLCRCSRAGAVTCSC